MQYPGSGPGPSHLSGPPYTPSHPNFSHHPNPYPHPHPYAHPHQQSHSPSHAQAQGPVHPQRRSPTRAYHMDDGLTPNLWNPAPALTWTRKLFPPLIDGHLLMRSAGHSSDLAAFSLNQGQGHGLGPNHLPHPQAGSSSMSSRPSSRHLSPYSTQPSSLQSRTSSERSGSDTFPSFGDLRIRGQDDGFSLLPIFPTQPSVSNLISDTPNPPIAQDPGGDMTLAPIRGSASDSRGR
jgi:hypothetical protein